MALTRTYKGGDTDSGTTGGRTLTVSTGAVIQDELIVVCVSSAHVDTDLTAAGTDISCSDTGGNSWTEVTRSNQNGRYSITTSIFYAQMAAAGTFTITVTTSNVAQDEEVAAMRVYGFTEHNGVGGSGVAGGDNIVETVTLSGTPLSTSQIIGVAGANEFSALTYAPSTGANTELHEDHVDSVSKVDHTTLNANSAGLSMQTQVRTDGTTGTSFAWTMTVNDNEYVQAIVALEVFDGPLADPDPPVPFVPRRYQTNPVKSKLGRADRLEVWILDRGLRKQLAPIGWATLDWERVQDESSSSHVTVPIDSQGTLRGCRPWRHGLGIYRNGQREWVGPIVNIKRDVDSDAVTVTARDKIAWTFMRFVRTPITFDLADLGVFFDLLIAEAATLDNPFGLSSNTPTTGVAGKREYLSSTDSQVFAAIQELARTGMDFTVWRDEIISGPTDGLFSGRLLVGAEAFTGRPGVELDGMSQGNSHRTAAGGTGGSDGFAVIGEYEDWDPQGDGLLETFETEALIRDISSAEAASFQRWEQFHDTPQVVTFPPISPQFPGTLDDLIPGKVWRVQIDDDLFDVAGDYRLTRVSVRADKGGSGEITETIQPELQRIT